MSLDGSPWIEAEELALVDDSPFYARQTVRTPSGGLGVAETCRPGSLDRAVSRWMVSLCVTRSDRVSIWHPLFAGPSRGRWARWARGAAAGAGMGS